MIPTDLTTIQVRLNGQAFAGILSLANEHLKTKRHMLKHYTASEESFDRTVDAIHLNNLVKDCDFYENLILRLQQTLVKKVGGNSA